MTLQEDGAPGNKHKKRLVGVERGGEARQQGLAQWEQVVRGPAAPSEFCGKLPVSSSQPKPGEGAFPSASLFLPQGMKE